MSAVVSEHPVAQRLKAYGVEEIVVIDDAFDVPDKGHTDDLASFWQGVREDTAARAQLEAIQVIEEAEQIDDEIVGKLWASKDDGTRLSALALAHLFASQLQQLKDLISLCSHLETVGFKPATRGAKDDSPVTARLVFLDYVLDRSRTMDKDALATEKAKAIYHQAADGKKPFIVLMSDQEDAVREHATFRRKSELMAGLFGFLTKAEATARDTLFLRLASWGIGNPAFADLQDFADAVLSAVKSASEKFSEGVRGLDVHDYSVIQRLSLLKEGHPLGDYLMWLFESSLGHALRDDSRVKAAQAKLDVVQFKTYIASQRMPSDRLAQFYLSAVTEPAVSTLQSHPHDSTGKMPLLFLGDVFLSTVSRPVMMVVTAACDLAFRPLDTPTSDATQPIYLAPGLLREVGNHGERASDICTELVVLDGKSYRIEWDYKHVETKRLGDVWKELKDTGYERKWRLRLPYAIAVQQAFVNHVSRVGLPVPPPLFQEANVHIFAPDEKKTAQLVGAVVEGGAALTSGTEGTDVILTRECVERLMGALEGVAVAAEKAAAVVPEGDHKAAQVKACHDRAANVRSLSGRTDLWVKMLEVPFKLPKGENHHAIDQKLLWARCGAELKDKPMVNQPMLFINIELPAFSAAEADSEALPASAVPEKVGEVAPAGRSPDVKEGEETP